MPLAFESASPYERGGDRGVLSAHQIVVAGGVETRRDPLLKDDYQAQTLTNIDPFRTGTVLVRGGLTFRARSSVAGGLTPYGLTRWRDNDVEFLVAQWGEYVVLSRGGVCLDTNLMNYKARPMQIVQTRILNNDGVGRAALAAAVLEGDREDLHVWWPNPHVAGSWGSEDKTAVEPRCLVQHLGRLWAGAGNTVYWSDLDDARSGWGASNSFDVAEDPGENEITALIPIREDVPAILVFLRRAIYLVTYELNFTGLVPTASQLRVVTLKTGCVATRSVADAGATIFFLAEDGVRVIARGYDDRVAGTREPVSKPIQDWIDRISWPYIQRAYAWVYREVYYLAVPVDGATTPSHVFALDISEGGQRGWMIWEVPLAGATLWAGEEREKVACLYGESVTEGGGAGYHLYVQEDTAETDPASGMIESEIETRAFSFGVPELRKVDDRASLAARAVGESAASITAHIRGDGGAWRSLGSVTLPAPTAPTLPAALPAVLNHPQFTETTWERSRSGHAYEWQYRLEGSGVFEIRRFTARAHPERDY